MLKKTPALIALLAAGALALSGCSAIQNIVGGGDDATRDSDTNEVTEAGEGDVFALSVGDCLDDTGSGMVSEVPLVPCSDSHDWEVYNDFSIDEDGDYPGDDAIGTAAEDGCYAAFADFVGIAPEESELVYNYYTPSSDSWDSGDRLVSCLVGDSAGQVEGTLEGAAR